MDNFYYFLFLANVLFTNTSLYYLCVAETSTQVTVALDSQLPSLVEDCQGLAHLEALQVIYLSTHLFLYLFIYVQ